MAHSKRNKLVVTVKDKCRVCYTCVRECPVKAIRILNGQAEILDSRCIGCGNCVKVCSQEAKVFIKQINEVEEILTFRSKDSPKVIACIAPSFPAEFTEIQDHRIFVGMVKQLGFDHVLEVAFGADIIANEYKKLFINSSNKYFISSDCPAIVFYIEQYHPEFTDNLAPIASPMVATARIAKKKYGDDSRIIFIGPCIVKKAESNEINEVLTFRELREMFQIHGIKPENSSMEDFDPPFAGKGAVFPLTRGLSQTMDIMDENLYSGDIISAAGRVDFRDAIKEFTTNKDHCLHLELLCCEGCIMGPGMSKDGKRYLRQLALSNYIRKKRNNFDREKWHRDFDEYNNLDFHQTFVPNDKRYALPSENEIEEVLLNMGKKSPVDHLNCGACGYDTCEEHAIAIIQGLAENEMCLPYTIEKLHNYIKELNISNEKLANARVALVQSEKLAHMGQLSAGIAHELNNPLGIISMYSNILLEESHDNEQIKKDLKLIVEQADRCRNIVGGLLNFARKSHVNYSVCNLQDLLNRSLESVIKPDNVSIVIENNLADNEIQADSEQMIQVFTNMVKNAIEAMPGGGIITIKTSEKENEVYIYIVDNGTGIQKEHLKKNIFEPFFTTKKVGKGTGLGLALIYGIIKMHRGSINVTSNADPSEGPTGTTFKITLPKKKINLN